MVKNKSLVLIIDDEPELLDIYGETLKEAGFKVITALNGPEGIRQAKANLPGLILLDLKMQGMDGIDVFKLIKADPQIKNIKIIIFSAFGDSRIVESDIEAIKKAGAFEFVKKGLDLEEFVKRVREALE